MATTVFDDVVGQHHITQTSRRSRPGSCPSRPDVFGSEASKRRVREFSRKLSIANGPTSNRVAYAEHAQISRLLDDVFEIDGASNNSVEQIREIRESVKFVAGRRKVYIIDEVHMLSVMHSMHCSKH